MWWLKYLHVTCVILSGAGFFLRGTWMIRDSPRLRKRWVRVWPHIIDTALLVSAILLTIQIRQYPFVHHWLTAKVLALVAYIVIGAVGLKYGMTKKIRIIAWLVAMVLFFYIVLVALTRQVLPYIG
ncbi:MAG: SirB2 family protein [Gammaproteobacteria bacterium]|nr:SirB2 family protein [Gammaproteobacteria bacterium]MDH3370180.1 SirB2 family protein [Gammaproteobacteria bacterium]MDH3405366.1 SirB2 family protein [Gammaproteobacteria bacterium]MDH3563945.1 SirB2 family protein [Gammaproteobacteria bacterium]MDH5487929.1 SirB2 family protein [Gammaproteobacteria bacterium]